MKRCEVNLAKSASEIELPLVPLDNSEMISDYKKRKEQYDDLKKKFVLLIDEVNPLHLTYTDLQDPTFLEEEPDNNNINTLMQNMETREELLNNKFNSLYASMQVKIMELINLRAQEFLANAREEFNKRNISMFEIPVGQDYDTVASIVEGDLPRRFSVAIESYLKRTNKIKVDVFPTQLSDNLKLEEKFNLIQQLKEKMFAADQPFNVLKNWFNPAEMEILSKGK